MRIFFYLTVSVLFVLPVSAQEGTPISKTTWEFGFEGGASSRQIKAQDRVTQGRGEFNSGALPHSTITLGYAFTESFKSAILGSFQQNEFQDVSEAQATQRPDATNEYELRLRRSISNLAEVRFGFGSQKRLFSRAENFNQFVFDDANVMFWGVGVEGAFVIDNNMLLGAMVDFRSLGSSNTHGYAIEEGSEVKSSVFAKKRLHDLWWMAKIFYNFSDQNSLLVKQTEKQTGISLGVTYVY
ncbi:hypothetical protein AZI86_03580 [Bdellovibrio bacteriovorus]|uniref:Outer membrane protein beta-barrel domain-containing protein n=1 Tax=Bdellovibrio bacteriovorus TaxID=959 RepID=A0A150WPN5_BDEBC|nr:hypothetical protein [Bdellovibrio bacteriovorus]KYG66155.1 hypothetical protein AZI86_03580 [Bdellovibrio bacteriovorus]